METIEKKTVLWSADWNLTNGQAIVTKRVFERQPEINWIIACYGGPGLKSIALWIVAILKLYVSVFVSDVKSIYLVCSRSRLGFVRDMPALIPVIFGVRTVVHVHGNDLNYLLSDNIFGRAALFLYSKCEVIVPSQHMIESLRNVLKSKIHVCENFLPEPLEICNKEYENREKTYTIVWNSNIMASKGYFNLVEAVAIARKKLPMINFVSLGVPMNDSEMSYQSALNRLEILCKEVWFHYVGLVTPAEAYNWTSKCDLYIYPSKIDCQPLALIQAMCLGKPIIINSIPPLCATLDDYPAKKIIMPTPMDLANEIIRFYDSCEFPNLEEYSRKSRQRFSPQRFDNDISKILNQ